MWEWPELEIEKQFVKTASQIWKREIRFVPQHCPKCGEVSLHVFFNSFIPGRASIWVWCHQCHMYVHSQGKSPPWWSNFTDKALEQTQTIENIDSVRDAIDKHVNKLLSDK
jgi:hypothetical protein